MPINEGALQQYLVMAFEHIKTLDRALTDVTAEASTLAQAIQDSGDERLKQSLNRVRGTRARLGSLSLETEHGEYPSDSEYDEIIQRLLNGEVC